MLHPPSCPYRMFIENKMAQRWPKMAQCWPKMAQDCPKKGEIILNTWNILTILSCTAREIFIYLKNPEFELKITLPLGGIEN